MNENEAYRYFNHCADKFHFQIDRKEVDIVPHHCQQKRLIDLEPTQTADGFVFTQRSRWQTGIWQNIRSDQTKGETQLGKKRVEILHWDDGRASARKTILTPPGQTPEFNKRCLLLHEAWVYHQLRPYQDLGRMPNFLLATALTGSYHSDQSLNDELQPQDPFALYLEAVPNSVSYSQLGQLNLSSLDHRLCLFQLVCALLEASELCGFNHLDLHPGNILIRSPTRQPQTLVYHIQNQEIHLCCHYQVVIVDLERASCQSRSGQRMISECLSFYDPTINAPWFDIARLCLELRETMPDEHQPLLAAVFEGCFHLPVTSITAEQKDGPVNWPTWEQIANQVDNHITILHQAEEHEMSMFATHHEVRGPAAPTTSQTMHLHLFTDLE
jgi:hypothetical protein